MRRAEREYLRAHTAHDYKTLLARWKAAARAGGLKGVVLSVRSGFPLYLFRSRKFGAEPVRYASAGVHGDEPAPVTALLEWAEENPGRLRDGRWLLFPCLNPWGLVNNRRVQEDGSDLNRLFNSGEDQLVNAWRSQLEAEPVAMALSLHEDFDALGTYIYEHGRSGEPVGARLLRSAARAIAPDPRERIEGRRAKDGLVYIGRRLPKLAGRPEALELHRLGAERTLTLETPSEFSFFDRVAAHRRMIAAAFR